MKILLLGAAGFIGTNLTIELAKKTEDEITLVDRSKAFFKPIVSMDLKNVHILEADLTVDMDFDSILKDQEVVYHLVSTTVPTTSNQHISQELVSNVIFSANLFEACIRCGVKKVVFVSSGGTVYGKEVDCPLKEKTATNPISSYGVQKITIEKLLYLYRYMYGLDYRIIRLANPYGPYQRPNGVLGAVTTFTYKALKGDEITVYGDGSVVRDFIYIDDAIRAIMKIVNGENGSHRHPDRSGHGGLCRLLSGVCPMEGGRGVHHPARHYRQDPVRVLAAGAAGVHRPDLSEDHEQVCRAVRSDPVLPKPDHCFGRRSCGCS